MKNTHLQITTDIELETINAETVESIKRTIKAEIEGHIYNLSKNGDVEFKTWTIKARTEKEEIQTQSERTTPFATITAYFSSDGPAFIAEVQSEWIDRDSLKLTLSDINAALREAYHKYIIKLREN